MTDRWAALVAALEGTLTDHGVAPEDFAEALREVADAIVFRPVLKPDEFQRVYGDLPTDGEG